VTVPTTRAAAMSRLTPPLAITRSDPNAFGFALLGNFADRKPFLGSFAEPAFLVPNLIATFALNCFGNP